MFDPSFCRCRTSPKGFLVVHIGTVDQKKISNENDEVKILTSTCLYMHVREKSLMQFEYCRQFPFKANDKYYLIYVFYVYV